MLCVFALSSNLSITNKLNLWLLEIEFIVNIFTETRFFKQTNRQNSIITHKDLKIIWKFNTFFVCFWLNLHMMHNKYLVNVINTLAVVNESVIY